ncbi:MAG: hypothetical protein EPO40_21960 [Myxococcaceae bacterium]|nr:MAG: hypothetical protein EPO40_21960 [Myxococcaceae bacterium]
MRRADTLSVPASRTPRYELRIQAHGIGDLELEVWQIPSSATPELKHPQRVAGLRGRNLALIETRLLRRLKRAGVEVAGIARGGSRSRAIDEDLALNVGLLFRVLAPMRDRSNMAACAEGIEAMSREEAAYWLGMAMHRKNPRRVLTALRYLLTEPKAVKHQRAA